MVEEQWWRSNGGGEAEPPTMTTMTMMMIELKGSELYTLASSCVRTWQIWNPPFNQDPEPRVGYGLLAESRIPHPH